MWLSKRFIYVVLLLLSVVVLHQHISAQTPAQPVVVDLTLAGPAEVYEGTPGVSERGKVEFNIELSH